jgi:5'-3' exoribonuclease 2
LDVQEKADKERKLKSYFQAQGYKFPFSSSGDGKSFDKNVITPGTEFMEKMAYIKSFIIERLQTNPLWKHLKIIFSDASVPGEGEHKILEYIRG